MSVMRKLLPLAVFLVVSGIVLAGPLRAAKDDVPTPKEYGVYVRTAKKLVRILPNIVFNEGGMLYVESNNPARFPLSDVRYFVVYGRFDMQFLTVNHLSFFAQSPLGKARFMLGKEVPLQVTKKSDLLYSVKPKGLFGRGYYAVWINDTAWDFIVE